MPCCAVLCCAVLCCAVPLQVLPSDQIQKGYGALVESLDDLLLDVPDAVELLSLFIARGVVSACSHARRRSRLRILPSPPHKSLCLWDLE